MGQLVGPHGVIHTSSAALIRSQLHIIGKKWVCFKRRSGFAFASADRDSPTILCICNLLALPNRRGIFRETRKNSPVFSFDPHHSFSVSRPVFTIPSQLYSEEFSSTECWNWQHIHLVQLAVAVVVVQTVHNQVQCMLQSALMLVPEQPSVIRLDRASMQYPAWSMLVQEDDACLTYCNVERSCYSINSLTLQRVWCRILYRIYIYTDVDVASTSDQPGLDHQ